MIYTVLVNWEMKAGEFIILGEAPVLFGCLPDALLRYSGNRKFKFKHCSFIQHGHFKNGIIQEIIFSILRKCDLFSVGLRNQASQFRLE